MEPIVEFNNVYKTYSFYKNQSEKLLDILTIKKKKKSFSALRGVSFKVYKGESIGVIGINGSGKSTLSNLLAQIGAPSSGKITLRGEPSLIAISAGLNNNLTGLENIQLKCLMMGLKINEIKEITPEIIEFADIGDFIYQPVKNYSSGMKSRLGFAISIHTNPDILIIDEALSVGDQTYYEKCIKKMEEFKSQGKTIFFISHSISQVRNFCDRVMWLHFGEIKRFGEKTEVLKDYKEFIGWFNLLTEKEKKEYRTQMLQEQFNNNINTRIISRKKHKNRKNTNKKISFLSCFVLLVIFLFYTIFLVTTDKQIGFPIGLKSKDTKDIKAPKTSLVSDKKILAETINKKGFIIVEAADLFSDSKFTQRVSSISFATPILILEKVDDIYKIEYNGTVNYINGKYVQINEDEIQTLNYKIEDLLNSLPLEFSRSYSYYLAFLGEDYEVVKRKIWGIREELVDSIGNKVQLYQSVSYTFNHNNVAETITVLNVDPNDEMINQLIEGASIKNEEAQLYYLRINGYQIVINLQKNTISFKLAD
jgi:teichoic acid transport system ATP-binding protein